jgi:hypothetical protein
MSTKGTNKYRYVPHKRFSERRGTAPSGYIRGALPDVRRQVLQNVSKNKLKLLCENMCIVYISNNWGIYETDRGAEIYQTKN